MPELPDRPDADQLRHQARELHRAAADGDARALGRLREVSDKVTLSAAQLAIARDYGFPSWPRLKAEVDRRRAQAHSRPRAGHQAQPGSDSQTDHQAQPGSDGQTGQQAQPGSNGQTDHAAGATPPAVKSWEKTRDAGADELIEAQYADRPELRPVLDIVLAALPALGQVTVQARKTLVSLVGPRRTFAVVQATTKHRVDLGLRLDNEKPGGRLLAARDIGAANLRIPLTGPADIDEEVLGWLDAPQRILARAA
jgi:Domain of unknown function (DUF5655)